MRVNSSLDKYTLPNSDLSILLQTECYGKGVWCILYDVYI